MKRLMTFLITILVIALLLGSASWYFLIYNPMILHNALMNQARSFAARGDYSFAFWCYDQAGKLTDHPNSPEFALELANQYLSIGNYTQAEVALTNAIQANPTTELYLRLSQVYVEQDKLLDANNLIEGVSDAAIRAELEAMRPAAPTATPEPGFYNTYITVSVSGTGGTLYVTEDGSYPSTWTEPYSKEITLPGGQTTLLAMVVGENGLVSPLATLEYTVVGVIEPVQFEDPAMEAAVRELLSMPEDKTIYTNDLWQITSFEIPVDASSPADLAKLTYLEELTAAGVDFSDSDVFSSLTGLRTVRLSSCILGSTVLEQIAALPALSTLALPDCSLSNISALSAASGLTTLELGNNAIRDIDVLGSLTSLQYLDLNHNALTDLSAIAKLAALQHLDVAFNSLMSIAPLSGCTALTYLDISHNEIITLTAVDQMKELTSFLAGNNAIESVELLSGCVKLTDVDISNNAITDITCLATLTAMTDLNFSYNAVTELPALPVDCALVNIYGEHNNLTSLEPLADLYWLDYVYMDYNEELDSVDALENCPNLVQVNVYGTKVTDISALVAHSIIVNYNPVQD